MAIFDYDSASDLLGKTVHLSRRAPGLTIEVYGHVLDVLDSVPGDPCTGLVQLVWSHESDSLTAWYNLSEFIAE